MQDKPIDWSPFPIVNGERTTESQKLIDKKYHKPTEKNLSDIPDAPY